MYSKVLSFFKNTDYIFLLCILSMGLFGIFSMANLSGAEDSYSIKQLIWIILGVITFLFFSKIDFNFLKDTRLILIIYVITNFVLASTLVLGSLVKGSKAWLSIGGISLQPADFAKLALIVLLAKYFSKRHIEIKHFRHIIVSFIYTIIPVFFILLQPDLGSALVILFIWFVMVLMSGLSRKHFLTLVVIGITIITIAWTSALKPYQKARIISFVNPLADIRGSGYNVYQAQIAIGSGGLVGKGVGFGTQSRLNYLPEHKTDFIFAAYAEEWGLLGVIILCAIILLFLWRILYIGFLSTNNFFTLMAVGVFAWMLIHILVNIGMNLGLLPVTGIPLPFMSYGGSHFLAESMALGLVASFSKQKSSARRKYNNEFLGLE